MKFTDGYWLLRDGVTPHYPAEAYEVATGERTLTVYAPTKRIEHRGDTLNRTMLKLEFSAPLPGVIGVKFSHFTDGNLLPAFGLNSQDDAPVVVDADAGAATLSSGPLTVRVSRGPRWQFEFLLDGTPITGSGFRALAALDVAGQGSFMREELDLGVGELVYGLGERFTPFVKNGQIVDIWNKDGGTASEQSYKNVPFYMTNRGYGVFVNHPEQVSFEIASEKVSRVGFSVPGQVLEYFIIAGPTPKEVLGRYTALTGRPPLPPAWSFGLWLTTSFTTSYDEATVTSFIQGMADRDLPLHVFHFDCFWMRAFHWCDFVWDPVGFPDPEGMLARLKERGLHISVWINSYIAQRSHLFAEAAEAGYLLRRADGSVWQTDMWQAGMGVVDFTNPAACTWFAEKLRPLLEMGVDCFKTDFGERIPTDVVYYDGSNPERMHNYYSFLYNKVVFDLLREVRGEGEAVVFARSATAGGQQFPVHWGGDCDSTFPSMAESLRGGLSLGLSGFGFWSHDIGGFEGLPDPALYERWLAFGLLSSHSRLHGSSSYRVPWLISDTAVDVLRHFTRLKCRLMPYLFGQAVATTQSGVPVMRAMLLDFPEDPTCGYLDRQYMLGDSLLVAPVFSRDGSAEFYLPQGVWTRYETGEAVQGGRWLREQHGPMSIPLLVRPNTVLAVGANADQPDYSYADGVTLECYQLAEETPVTVRIPTTTGGLAASFTVEKRGGVVTVERDGAELPWRVLLVGSSAAGSEQSERGALVAAEAATGRLEIRLAA